MTAVTPGNAELLALAVRLVVASDILRRKPCEVYGLQQDCLAAAEALRRAAKPDEDGMREALEKIKRRSKQYAEIAGDSLMGPYKACKNIHEIADAALSAPVPPADGANHRWLNDLVKAAGAFRIAMVVSGALNKVGQDNYVNQLRTLEAALNPFNYRSPSPAAAAEPDDDWEDRSERSYIDNTKEVTEPVEAATLLDRPSRPGEKRVFGPDASPPVRGDREATRQKIIELTNELLSPDYLPETVEKFADAILSLPVQPGAERESVIEECAKIADAISEQNFALAQQLSHQPGERAARAASDAADIIADDIRCLSRQAPQSSSEGGR